MSTGLAHFAVGGLLTTLVVAYLVPGVRYPRVVVVLGGLWGMLPDAWRLSPVNREALRSLHHSPYADVFWFHSTLDRLDPADSRLFAFAAVLGLLAVTVLAERREYRAHAAVRERFGDSSDSLDAAEGE